MNKLPLRILMFFLWGLTFKALAVAFVTPVQVTSSGTLYSYTQKIISWDEASNAPNPCYGWQTCYVGPDVVYPEGPGNLGNSCERGNCIEASRLRTAAEVAAAYRQIHGIPKTAFFQSSKLGVCTGLVYISQPDGGFGNGKLWPQSICGKIPPVNQSCNISLPPLIDYGTIGSRSLEGKKMTITGTVTCSLPATLVLYGRASSGEQNVYMNSSRTLYATLEINNTSPWDGINFNATGNNSPSTFSFSTTLHSIGKIETGTYSGSAIVFLSYP